LAHLISSLKAAGIVKAIRGAQGGFVIAKPPSQITLDEVVQSLEGKIVLAVCVGNPKAYPYSSLCATYDLWREVAGAMVKALKDRTLQDLLNRQKEKEKSLGLMTGAEWGITIKHLKEHSTKRGGLCEKR
jgi:Rrf2 family protein